MSVAGPERERLDAEAAGGEPPGTQVGAGTVVGTDPAAPAPGGAVPARLHALDAARGLAIVVMLVVMNPGPAGELPDQLHHPPWHGLTFADLFFPLFLFAVGVSMTLSRRGLDVRHALYRAGVLFVLGVALASLKHERLALTGVLQHIAGSYLLALAVLRLPRRWQPPVAAGMVVLAWVAFVAWAGPGADPWGRSGTLAHAVDARVNGGFTSEGTLQTAASAVTVLGGAFAGRWIRRVPDRRRLVRGVAAAAAAMLGLGLLMALAVPVNKRLWTPSFTVLTLGTSLAWLALGVWLVDVRRARRATAPLVHLGANPIFVYALSMAALAVLRNHGDALTPAFAPGGNVVAGAFAYAAAWTALWWLVAFVLYRRRIFVKI